MDENQINPETGYQQNQPLQDNLTDNQTLPGNYQEDTASKDRNMEKEFPERTQQHDYKNPSANQIQNDEEDVNTDGEIFDQDEENEATDPVDEQSL